jgi:hypothetical protein
MGPRKPDLATPRGRAEEVRSFAELIFLPHGWRPYRRLGVRV